MITRADGPVPATQFVNHSWQALGNYSLARDGFELVEHRIDQDAVESLRLAMAQLPSRHRGGVRNLLRDSETIAALASSESLKSLADAALGADAFPVRGLFFDKSPDANWKVPWHQDTAIAVAERIEMPGFIGWSVKDDVPHVHPPTGILERMVALRIHLDDCGRDNGTLRVLPGSHRDGKLDDAAIDHWRQTTAEVSCCAASGDVLLMRTLLLHASSPVKSPSRRRVIHLEYACETLPGGLKWFELADPCLIPSAQEFQPLT